MKNNQQTVTGGTMLKSGFQRKLGLIGIVMLFLLLVLQIGVMIYTKTNSSIHDLLSDTVVVEYASQQIFETEEDLIAYKKAEHEKMVNGLREERYSSSTK